jgi:hypothetical protein
MYASRRFSDRERRWEISCRELYAVKYALEKFRPYLCGYHDVVLHTDHLNLVTGLYSHASPKIERWRMYIESCRPFKIQHVKGNDATQAVADGLSRLHVANLALEKCPDEWDEEAMLQAELGEGGLDDNMFNSHITAANAWERLTKTGDTGREEQRTPRIQCTTKGAAECTTAHAWASIISNSTDDNTKQLFESGKVLTKAERRMTDDIRRKYGVGCELLEKMGWTVRELDIRMRRLAPWEDPTQHTFGGKKNKRQHKGYPGFGLGSCNMVSDGAPDIQETSAASVEIDDTYEGDIPDEFIKEQKPSAYLSKTAIKEYIIRNGDVLPFAKLVRNKGIRGL